MTISKLQAGLHSICQIQCSYNYLSISNLLIGQQSRFDYLRHTQNLIELFHYLQSNSNALSSFLIDLNEPSIEFDEILENLRRLWINEFIPESIQSKIDESNYIFQCNIKIVEDFVTSIPETYTVNKYVDFFNSCHEKSNLLNVGILENFLCQHISKPLDVCLRKLYVLISIQYIRQNINDIIISPTMLKNLSYSMDQILLTWSLDQLHILIKNILKKNDITCLNTIFNITVEYRLEYDAEIVYSINHSKCVESIHGYALQKRFSNLIKTYNLNELLDEIVNRTYSSLNTNDKALQRQRLSSEYQKFLTSFAKYNSFDEKILKDRLKDVKNMDFYSLVAFVVRASDVLLKEPMRIVQILSVLLALDSSRKTAQILQINTGEGKTRIVSVLAVTKALQGQKVDVITSSVELAKVQSEKLKSFYNFFNLTVACNANLSLGDYAYAKQRKILKAFIPNFIYQNSIFQPVYECNVVYGSADDFEADILRNDFNGTGIRCDRQCEFAIVDEVDNMMVDGRQHTLRLSSAVPSVFYLLPIKGIIWNQILNISNIMVKKDDQWYKLNEDEEGKTHPELLNESIIDFCEKLILPLLKDYIHLKDTMLNKDSQKLLVPKHLHKMISKKLSLWIRNAAYAKFEMQEGYHYILRDKKIIYVDVENTGVLHPSMRWGDGTHCFLEMKHGCALKPEYIVTNYISHVTFFCRYSTNLIGVTGTVGGKAIQEFFHKVYSADCGIIPPFRERRHYELQYRILSNEIDWYECIINSCEEKMKQNRAVLLITKFIQQAQEFHQRLNKRFPNQVKLYTKSEEKEVLQKTLNAGDIIIATNIAGRGTDVLVSHEVEQNGGLHVCIAFLPDNDRVERQNQGRTSRCGNKGTSQFIINFSDNELNNDFEICSNNNNRLEEMRNYRDKIQLNIMKSAIEATHKIVLKDKIFQQYSKLQNTIIQCFPDNVKDIVRDALRERFGRWLLEVKYETDQDLQQSFNTFISDCQDDTENTLIDNPMYYVQMANKLLIDQTNLDDAIIYLNKAIEMDRNFAASAYYSRGYARALQYKKTKDISNLENAISNFEESRRIINEMLDPAINFFPVASDNSPLHEYLIHLKTLYGTLVNSINMAIGRPVGDEINQLTEQLKSKEIDDKKRKELNDYLKELQKNRTQIENGILRNILKNKTGIKIERKSLLESLASTEKTELYKDEINEFETNGFIGTIVFNERKPIQWWSVISVGLIGLSQAIAGVSLAVFSVGAGVGLGWSLLQEGISDLITCVKNGIIGRNFSWAQWGIQKAINLAITIACAGFNALKAAARTTKAALTTGKNAIKFGAKELWTKTVKEGFTIAGKKVALATVQSATIAIVTPLVNYAVSMTIFPIVQEMLQTEIDKLIKLRYSNYENLHRLIKCDSQRRNRFYATKLKENILSHVNQSAFVENCRLIGLRILNHNPTNLSETTVRTLVTVAQLQPIITNLYKIADSFTEEIDTLAKSKDVDSILNGTYKDQGTGLNYVQTNDKQAENEQLPLTITEFCNDITEKISDMICEFLQGTLVPPLVNSTINPIFSSYNDNINRQICKFHTKRHVAHHQILSESETKMKVNGNTLAAAKNEIENLRNGAPGEIHHLGYISEVTNRRIIIYDEQGRVEQVIGNDTSMPAIEIVYYPPKQPNGIGHWANKHESTSQNTGR